MTNKEKGVSTSRTIGRNREPPSEGAPGGQLVPYTTPAPTSSASRISRSRSHGRKAELEENPSGLETPMHRGRADTSGQMVLSTLDASTGSVSKRTRSSSRGRKGESEERPLGLEAPGHRGSAAASGHPEHPIAEPSTSRYPRRTCTKSPALKTVTTSDSSSQSSSGSEYSQSPPKRKQRRSIPRKTSSQGGAAALRLGESSALEQAGTEHLAPQKSITIQGCMNSETIKWANKVKEGVETAAPGITVKIHPEPKKGHLVVRYEVVETLFFQEMHTQSDARPLPHTKRLISHIVEKIK